VTEETSLRDELAAGFEGAEASAPEIETADSSDTSAAAAPSGEPSPPLEPPKHWSEADRTLFGSAPRPLQERWIAREKEYNDGFNKRGQELTRFKRGEEAWNEIFSKLDSDLRLNGMNRHQYVTQLLEWNNRFRSDPAGAIRSVAKELGVDLKTLLSDPNTQSDPAVQKLTEELSTIKKDLTAREEAARQAELKQNHDRVAAFAEAKGDNGQPLHPYFDDVAPDVVRLLKADPKLGLERAYEKAIRMNDDVWTKVQADKAKDKATEQDRKRQAAVDKAKRAAVGSESEVTGATKPRTLRDELNAGFSGWGTN
jgi:hypothetical protein